MARVGTKETVKLQDGEDVTLRPLNITYYRKFQTRWNEFTKQLSDDSDDDVDEFTQLDFLVDLAAICLEREVGEEKAKDREWLEDALDSDTIRYIIKVCAGVDLAPEAAMVTAIAAQSGMSSN